MKGQRREKGLYARIRELAARMKERVAPFGTVHVGGLYVVAEERRVYPDPDSPARN